MFGASIIVTQSDFRPVNAAFLVQSRVDGMEKR
jgi:hypothetical protein